MAEVAFRPARHLSEYKGKGASASREVLLDTELFSLHHTYRSPQEENVPQIPYNDVNL